MVSNKDFLASATLALCGVYLALVPDVSLAQILDEITVTATKRETSVQEIPMSIDVVSGDDLRDRGVDDLQELASKMPNMEVGDGLLTTGVAIRGLGSQPERSIEQSVGMYIDGVYMPRSRQYRAPFLDVARVEVLRGPQAVLFGLNSVAGAISIVTNTNQPGDEFEAEFLGSYEFEHGGPQITGIIGGSPTDTLGLRLVAQYQDRDGYFRNDFNGAETHASEETVVRGTAVWQPTESVEFKLKAEFGDLEIDGSVGEQIGDASLNTLVAAGFPPSFVTDDLTLDWRHNMDESFIPILTQFADQKAGLSGSGLAQEYVNVSLSMDWEINEHVLTALISDSDTDWDLATDLDGIFLPIADAGINEHFDQQAIEVRLTSPAGRTFDYIIGIYAHSSELINEQPNVVDPTFATAPGAFGFDQAWANGGATLDDDVRSIFATGTWNISDTFRATAGVRWVDQEKDYARFGECQAVNGGVVDFSPAGDLFALEAIIGPGSFFCPNLIGFQRTFSSDNVLPEIAFQWDSSDDVMWFLKYGESAKGGGFAFSTIIDPNRIEYQDEEADNIELGLKARLGDGRGTLNVTVYRTEIDGLQVNTFDPVTAAASIQNAAEARSQGVEADFVWQVHDYWQLYGSVAILDNEFTSFPNAPCPQSEQLAGTPPPCDATGKPLPFAPDFSGNIGINAFIPINANIEFVGGINLGFKGDYVTDAGLERAFDQDSYTTIGANFGIESSDGRWGLSVIGTNLSDEAILNNATPFFTNLSFLKQPRMVMLQGRYSLSN